MKREKSDSTEVTANKKFKKSPKFPKKGNFKPGNKNKDKKKKQPKYEKPTAKNKITTPNKPNISSKVSKKGKPNMDKVKNIKKGETETPGVKPNWLEYKKEQKELKEKRRAKKLEDSYKIAIEAKQIGEKLRRTCLSPELQEKLTKKLHDLVKGKYAKMIFTHDISRVIQWQIKYCNEDIQLQIAEELKPHLREMLFSKYAKNVVRTLLKRGSNSVKKCILQECNGHVVKLLSNVLSASLFEKIYVEVASEAEKCAFKQEFYGDMYKSSKEPNVKTLVDVYKNSEDMKSATLSAVKANLIKILNKNLINSSLVHTVLYEYLSNCSKEDRAEIITMARPLITELSQTRDGTKAGNLCIWHGTNKDRKLIMKTLKEHIKDIMTSEHGHLMILGLLDCVDDTVLLKKILLQEVLNNLNEIVLNEYGRRVILYIVARRDTHYFHPALVEYLKKGDGNTTSKKPAEIREKELLESVIDNLLESISAEVKIWLSNGPIQLVTLAILKASHGDKPKSSFDAISTFITDTSSTLQKDTQTFVAIEEPGLHMVLKKLIQMDSTRTKENEITFGEILVQHLTDTVIEHWINYNRGCFLLITLIENESGKVISELKSKLKKISNLKMKETKGATILLKKL